MPKPINPQQEVSRHIYNLPQNQSASPSLKLQTFAAEDSYRNKEVLALKEKKNPVCQSTYILCRRGLFIYSPSFPIFLPLFLFLSLFGGEKGRREEWSSLSLRPECLAVFKWRTRTSFCLPRQIHCGGRWANTHTHILT